MKSYQPLPWLQLAFIILVFTFVQLSRCFLRDPENDTDSSAFFTEQSHWLLPVYRRLLPSRLAAFAASFKAFPLRSTLGWLSSFDSSFLPRKEVIQPHLPIRLPCYDFTPVIGLTLDGWLLAVTSPVSGAPNSHGVTGGVYKARERIHRGMLIRDY